MYKMLKFGVYFGAIASLASCSTSEHFMQDDVYNTRTPIMPPGTDLNDVTDYATFVAKKEQTEAPAERTTYVSPRQYTDYFYRSQYIYYGYSPYSSMSGLGYYGYGSYYHPNGYGYGNNLYPSVGFGSYYGTGYNMYGYNPYSYYGSSYYGGCGYYGQSYPSYGGGSWYTPVSKPNTGSNLSNMHAGTSGGRMGSSTNGGVITYPNQITANPNHGYTGVGRNTNANINSSPVGIENGRSVSTATNRASLRPAVSRPSTSGEQTGTYQRVGNPTINSGGNNSNNRTINNSTNSNTRTTPTLRGGSSGGGGSVSSPSSGGSRSGGRR
ncbi:hypothetical protein [Fluviicola sp.]|uniref:hypothetical protein n=1 Tax=Fluviicola sp. TaxID=1917219 RepID=UPI003D2DC724